MNTPALDILERSTGDDPQHSVIWLHGLGADGHDFEPIVHEFDRHGLPPMRFVFPSAPVRPITVNQGQPMRGWYDLLGRDLDTREDVDGIRATRQVLEGLLRDEFARGVAPEHVVLAGFSQGAAMTLYTGLRMDQRLGGLIALSGYLPLRNTLAAERHPANADTPVFVGHGLEDPVVPIARAEVSRDILVQLGQPTEWHHYPMGHGLHPQEIDDLRAFLRRVFGPQPADA